MENLKITQTIPHSWILLSYTQVNIEIETKVDKPFSLQQIKLNYFIQLLT